MKFTCPVSQMAEALSVVIKALPARTTNPILESVRIEAYRGEVILTCSDERITIITRFDAPIEEDGKGCAQGSRFNDFVRCFTSDSMTVSMNDNFEFHLVSGEDDVFISGQDADLYPSFPIIKDETEFNVPESDLKQMISSVEFSISPEDMREVLTGGYLELQNGEMNMVGLDGFRMAVKTLRINEFDQSIKAIVPGRCLSDIGKLLSDKEDAFCAVSVGDGKIHVSLEHTDVFVTLVSGQYVNYRQIIPKTFKTTLTIDTKTLIQKVGLIEKSARDGESKLLILKIEGEKMTLLGQAQTHRAKSQMYIEHEGEDIAIAFNVKYIQDVLKDMKTERVVFKMNSPIHPCVITPEGDADTLFLVLPVRTSNI